MSNSSLVVHTRISPNKTVGRTKAIDRISPHCVVGQVTAESLGNWFALSTTHASSNYGIDKDGRIALFVEEKDRSWCTSSSANDNRAITIECASDTKDPYTMNDVVYESLIELCVDICKRNGKTKLLWIPDKGKSLSYIPASDEMLITVHRWFENKSCPGDWLYSRLGDLATKVTAQLQPTPEAENKDKVIHRVQIGAFSHETNAVNYLKQAQNKGFDTYLVKVGNLFKVQIGAFQNEDNAKALMNKAKTAGFNDCFITTEAGTPVTPSTSKTEPEATVVKGSKVKVKQGAKTYTGGKVADFVYSKVYTVDELKGDRAVLDAKGLCTAFNVKDLILQ